MRVVGVGVPHTIGVIVGDGAGVSVGLGAGVGPGAGVGVGATVGVGAAVGLGGSGATVGVGVGNVAGVAIGFGTGAWVVAVGSVDGAGAGAAPPQPSAQARGSKRSRNIAKLRLNLFIQHLLIQLFLPSRKRKVSDHRVNPVPKPSVIPPNFMEF